MKNTVMTLNLKDQFKNVDFKEISTTSAFGLLGCCITEK